MKTDDYKYYSILTNNPILNKELLISTVIEHSNDTFYFKDLESRFIFMSKNVALRLGYDDPIKLIGKTDFDIFDMSHASQAYKDEQEIISTGKPIINKEEMETWQDGTIVWVSTSKYPLRDKDNMIIGTWGISRDISTQKRSEEELKALNKRISEANEKLEQLAKLDSISGLYNNRFFYEEIQLLFNTYKRQAEIGIDANFSIMLMDIDNFKIINDTAGHIAGDCAIKQLADVLKNTIRDTDKAFRYGGDEFAVIMPEANIYEASVIGDKIRNKISARPLIVSSNKLQITVSGGISSFDEARDVNELMTKADQRLYEAKRKGKNRISI